MGTKGCGWSIPADFRCCPWEMVRTTGWSMCVWWDLWLSLSPGTQCWSLFLRSLYQTEIRVGNIHKTDLIQLIGSHKPRQFGLDKLETLPDYCLECEVRFACNRGCPKNRILHTPAGEFSLNYLCRGDWVFFNHVDEPMKRMADLICSANQTKNWKLSIYWVEGFDFFLLGMPDYLEYSNCLNIY